MSKSFKSGLGGALVVVDKLAEAARSIAYLANHRVMVGIPAANTERRDGDPLTNAEIGYIQEHGAPEANIPARPFLKPTVAANQGKITAFLKLAGQKAMAGQTQGVIVTLNALGLFAKTEVQKTINSNLPPPLSERTLAARRARGVTRTNTLIDTGQLRNSITYVIRTVK